MALLAASRIPNLITFALQALGPLPSSTYRLKVVGKDGKDWKTVSAEEAVALAEKGQIFGKGSQSKLKCAVLAVDGLDAQMTVDEANAPPTSRKKTIPGSIPIAEANFTVKHVQKPTGQYFEPRMDICAGYNPALRRI